MQSVKYRLDTPFFVVGTLQTTEIELAPVIVVVGMLVRTHRNDERIKEARRLASSKLWFRIQMSAIYQDTQCLNFRLPSARC
jgi:hypothetical protein